VAVDVDNEQAWAPGGLNKFMIAPELVDHYREVGESCRYRLFGHPRLSMLEQLDAIAEQAKHFERQDFYGEGELIESFEREIASLLGKEAAVFLPSGTMAQSIALRIWSERVGSRYVGFHGTSHLELHEQKAYQALHGLHGILLGEPDRVVSLADLQGVTDPLAAVLLELPMREIGGQLPGWDELQSQSEWARQQGVALHMDGARLWQCTAHYGCSMAAIADLFDSVYLSFYKDMGGIAGSTLAGPEWFVQSARTWIRRAGGNLYSQFPYVLAAKAGMQRNLEAIPAAVESAAWLAAFLGSRVGLRTLPEQPPTNLFHLVVPAEPTRLVSYAADWSQRNNVLLMPLPRCRIGDGSVMEFSLGRAVTEVEPARWRAWLTDFFDGL
jgi:threonine aldolase